jgi:hypothetical protein
VAYLGRTSAAWNDVKAGSPSTSPVLGWGSIYSLLGGWKTHHIFSPLHVKNHPMIKEQQEIQRELTSDGMDSGHQTLNNTEVVMNDLIVDIRKH